MSEIPDSDDLLDPAAAGQQTGGEAASWTHNYFNYFTEIEEHFQKVRGSGLFLLSPVDWALIESWKEAGVPLDGVLRGIDAAFEKWRSRKSKARVQSINALGYCAQAVLEEAQSMERAAKPQASRRQAAAPFEIEELRKYILENAEALRRVGQPAFDEIAVTLERLAAEVEVHYQDLEQLEQRLSALDEKVLAIARSQQSDEALFEARRELDRQLRQYRGKMTADQLARLEKQYLDRRLLESLDLPRLSLFYIH